MAGKIGGKPAPSWVCNVRPNRTAGDGKGIRVPLADCPGLAGNGSESLAAVAGRLNDKGYLTRAAKPWTATAVLRVLAGLRRHKPDARPLLTVVATFPWQIVRAKSRGPQP